MKTNRYIVVAIFIALIGFSAYGQAKKVEFGIKDGYGY